MTGGAQQGSELPKTFALIGAAGFVAPRHLKAIHDTGNLLVAATDPHDSVGVLDQFFPTARFFTEIERFDRYLEKLRRDPEEPSVEFLSICSPNYLHDAHVRLALRLHSHAICEKPLVINPWNLNALEDLEEEYGRRIYTILQLRMHPALRRIKEDIASSGRADVCLTYVTRRGQWYAHSWKGSAEKSGGVVMNIGVHFFDVLLWLFGELEQSEVDILQPDRAAGRLILQRATVRWFLSVNGDDLPESCRQQGSSAHRLIQIDGEEVDFTEGFDQLHTRQYEQILAGNGFGIADARGSIELVKAIRRGEPNSRSDARDVHPLLKSL